MSASLMSVLAIVMTQDAPRPQTPDAPQAAVEPAPAEAPADEARLSEVVCRTEVVVGTRFNSRVCMTRREWNQRRDDSRRLAHRLDVQNSNRGRVTAPGH